MIINLKMSITKANKGKLVISFIFFLITFSSLFISFSLNPNDLEITSFSIHFSSLYISSSHFHLCIQTEHKYVDGSQSQGLCILFSKFRDHTLHKNDSW